MSRSGGTEQRARARNLCIEAQETLRAIELLLRMTSRPAGLGRYRVRDFGCCDGQTHTQTKVRIES